MKEPLVHAKPWGASQALGFVQDEKKKLNLLRDVFTGSAVSDPNTVEKLVDECDYLWAHFPECAGAEGQRPPLSEASFIKRIRAEIEPFAKAFTRAEQSLIKQQESGEPIHRLF